MTPPSTAVALLSAGLDSAAALAMALDQGWKCALALTFDYGQRAAKRETAQAATLARRFGVPHRTLALPWFREFSRGGGLLRQDAPLPTPSAQDLDDRNASEASARAVWVPNRNGVLLEIAAGFAEDLGAAGVLVGFNREEAATFPDNSEAYLEALTKALSFSTSNGVRVVSPTAPFTKSEIVAKLAATDFPFELLWSCYEPREKMCGRCESCRRLKRALAGAGVSDRVGFEDPALS